MFNNGFPKEWSTLRKLAWLYRTVINAVSAVLKTVTGNPIHITDALAKPAQALSVKLEPIQDLHGYDAPWPAGGGKNLLTALPSPGTTVWFCEPDGFLFKANQTYCFSISNDVVAGSYSIYAADKTTQLAYASSNRKVVYTPTVDTVGYPRLYAGEGVSQEAINSAQLELGNSRTTFAPYSNICPISGWTECKVARTGINVWDEEWEVGVISTTGSLLARTDSIRSANYIPVKPNTSYYFYIGKSTYRTRVVYFNGGKTAVGNKTAGPPFVFTTPSDCVYIKICTLQDSEPHYGDTYLNDISINYPATDTSYHAYQGQTYTITFPTSAGTVYGGTLDVTTGKLTVDRAFAEFDGSEDEDWSRYQGGSAGAYAMQIGVNGLKFAGANDIYVISNCLKSLNADATWGNYDAFISTNTVNGIKTGVRSITTVNSWREYLADAPLQIVYYLTTPIVYDLTPTEVSTLLGTNNVWSDGTMTLVYLADGNASDVEALNILLGNRYVNNHGEDEPTDREALDILLGGTR